MAEEHKITQTPTEFALDQGIINQETIELSKKKAMECYEKILGILKVYLDMPEEYMKIISIWIIGTYLHKEFDAYPFLFINAMRGSGKTRLMNIISSLSCNGELTNNMTESVLFRTAGRRTLVIDENESITKKEKSAFRELLNSAYKKGVSVERMKKMKHKEGEDMVVEKFELYAPIAMANISGMEEVLSDRCITLILEKSSNKKVTQILEDFTDNQDFLEIKRTLGKIGCSLCCYVSLKNMKKGWNSYILENNYIHTLTTLITQTTLTAHDLEDLYKKIKDLDIDGRNLEIYFPIIVLAFILSKDLLEEVLEIVKANLKQKKAFEAADSPDIALYEFISSKDPLSWYSISDLLNDFKHFYTSDDTDREWLNSRWLGRALRRLKLDADSKRNRSGALMLLDVGKAIEKSKIFNKRDEKVSEGVKNG